VPFAPTEVLLSRFELGFVIAETDGGENKFNEGSVSFCDGPLNKGTKTTSARPLVTLLLSLLWLLWLLPELLFFELSILEILLLLLLL
jgi:hypothetical protein